MAKRKRLQNDKESKLYPENSFTAPRYGADFQPIVNIVLIRAKNVKKVSKSSQGVYIHFSAPVLRRRARATGRSKRKVMSAARMRANTKQQTV